MIRSGVQRYDQAEEGFGVEFAAFSESMVPPVRVDYEGILSGLWEFLSDGDQVSREAEDGTKAST